MSASAAQSPKAASRHSKLKIPRSASSVLTFIFPKGRDESGTLTLELLVAAAVMALLLVAVGEMTVTLLRFERRQSALTEAERRAASGIETLREAAKGASAVMASGTVNGVAYVSGTSTVAFSLPPTNQSGDLLPGADYIGFRLDPTDPTRLLEDVSAAAGSRRLGGSFTVSPLVETFRVRYDTSTPADARLVDFYLETGRTLNGTKLRFPLETDILLENQ
jgi:type II secretory pathway pseudopilin PulG